MANQLGNSNQKQKLLSGTPRQKMNVSSKDIFVANVAEKRYLWTARAFAIITAISICCNVVLLMAIGQVIPLYRIEPFLLTFQNKSEQVYNIQSIRGSFEDEKAITEVFVREYVLLRSAFVRDIPEMETRWMPGGPVQEMSSSAVYAEFLEKTANKAIEIIRTKGLSRSIKVLTVNELGNGLWQVEYETQDMYPNSSAPDVNYWTASMRVTYRNKTVKHNERLKNPIGFTVTRYSLAHNNVK